MSLSLCVIFSTYKLFSCVDYFNVCCVVCVTFCWLFLSSVRAVVLFVREHLLDSNLKFFLCEHFRLILTPLHTLSLFHSHRHYSSKDHSQKLCPHSWRGWVRSCSQHIPWFKRRRWQWELKAVIAGQSRPIQLLCSASRVSFYFYQRKVSVKTRMWGWNTVFVQTFV